MIKLNSNSAEVRSTDLFDALEEAARSSVSVESDNLYRTLYETAYATNVRPAFVAAAVRKAREEVGVATDYGAVSPAFPILQARRARRAGQPSDFDPRHTPRWAIADAIDAAPRHARAIFAELGPSDNLAMYRARLAEALPLLPSDKLERAIKRVIRAAARRPKVQYGPDPTNIFELVAFPPDASDLKRRTVAINLYLRARSERPRMPKSAAQVSFDLETEPGLFGDVARWTQAYAFRPVREFAQPAALAVFGAIFGRRWATPSGLGLNLYQVAIGETGGGKDALLGAPKRLLSAAGYRRLIGPGDFTSDAAIETSLRMHPSQLMPLDEFGKLAQAMMGRNAPSFAKLGAKALLEIYPRSQPGDEWTGKQRADPTRDNASEPIYSPTLSILAVSTPEGFFDGMSQQTLEDGFLNRLTVVRAGKAGARQRDPARLDPPASLIETLRAACDAATAGNNLAGAAAGSASMEPKFQIAKWADETALDALEVVEAWEDDAREAGRHGVCGRAAEQTQKIATIRALARDPASPTVTAEDVQWAFAYVRSSIEAIEDGARAMMAGSEFETLGNAIEAALAAAGAEGLPRSVLLRKRGVSKHDDRMVDAALKRLQETHRIWNDVGTSKAGGRPSQRCRLRRPDE